MNFKKPPIFVVGCPRSGTTLLYHMLLSTGDFAIYRAETHVFNVLVPHFGNFASLGSRTRMIDEWLKTDYFQATGVRADLLRTKLLKECRSGGDFLRIVMGSIAENQGVNRWSECTPEHVLHLPEIKREVPQAKVIHVIRDGRDVALSLDQQGWIHPFAWDQKDSLLVAGLYWEYVVKEGRQQGKAIGQDYMEVRYERLVENPREELRGASEFVEQDLDYDQILRAGVGSVSRPNTSFPSTRNQDFNPVERWKGQPGSKIAELETLIGSSLREFGYTLRREDTMRDFRLLRMRMTYPALFAAKHWLKTKTPMGRFSSASVLYEPILENRAQ